MNKGTPLEEVDSPVASDEEGRRTNEYTILDTY